MAIESEYSPDPDNIMSVALGPQHPGSGHFRIRLWLDGDYVVRADPDPGYVHRGEEKMSEYRNYMQNVPHLERPAILDSSGILFPYAEAVDELMGNKVPPRGKYLRVIMAELNRIISHMYFLSIYGLFEGHTTMITWGLGDRDLFIDLAARIGGARVTFAYIIPGGVRNDMPADMTPKALQTFEWFEKRIQEYEKMWLNNPLLEDRLKGVGVLKREDAIRFGATGIVLRASGVKHDIRRAEPYSVYPEFDFDIPVSNDGDCWARAWVAIQEMRESLKILKQAFTKIPEGSVRLKLPIQPRVPAGEVFFRSEAAHGERAYHLISDGSPRPYRLKMEDPSFRNMILIRELLKGAHVADIPPIYWGLNYWPVSADR